MLPKLKKNSPYVLSSMSFFKFCCSNLAAEEEHSLEIELPDQSTSRPRAERSVHFNPEAMYSQNFNSSIFNGQKNNIVSVSKGNS